MPNRKDRRTKGRLQPISPPVRPGNAKPHAELKNDLVHIFVDDQNLSWGIVNAEMGPGFRIDFGNFLLAACRNGKGQSRGVGSAYIAGVIPNDDSFWQIAKKSRFHCASRVLRV